MVTIPIELSLTTPPTTSEVDLETFAQACEIFAALEWSALMAPTLPAKTGTTASGPNASTRAGPAKVETFFKS